MISIDLRGEVGSEAAPMEEQDLAGQLADTIAVLDDLS